jgi:transcriptional regulator with XRE-family HTH domain
MGCLHVKEALGARVKQLRQDAGITQATLSQRSGLFRTHLSRIECGTANPTLTAIVSIANALEVDPSSLLKDATRGPSGAD